MKLYHIGFSRKVRLNSQDRIYSNEYCRVREAKTQRVASLYYEYKSATL